MFELSTEQPKTIFTITRDGKIEFADGISKDEATTQAAQLLAEKFSALHQAQAAEITRLRAKVDAVYSERNRLAAAFARMALAAGFKAGKGVDPDETKWPVVYVDTPNGQVSWHIAEADQGALEGLPQYNGEWDGKFTARDPAWSVWPAAIRAAAGEGK